MAVWQDGCCLLVTHDARIGEDSVKKELNSAFG